MYNVFVELLLSKSTKKCSFGLIYIQIEHNSNSFCYLCIDLNE